MRLDPNALDERRVERTGDDGHQAPEPYGDDRQDPPSAPDVHDEQRTREQRDQQQQVGGRQLGVDVGVGRAVDDASSGERQLVATEPVVDRLDQREECEQHR